MIELGNNRAMLSCLLGGAGRGGFARGGSRERVASRAGGGLAKTKHGSQSLGSELTGRSHGPLGHDRSGYDRNDRVARRDKRFARLRPGIEERDILRKGKSTLSIEQVDGAGENDGNPDRPKMNGNQAGDIAGAHARKPPRSDQGNKDGKEGVSHAAQTLHEEVNEPKDGKNDET